MASIISIIENAKTIIESIDIDGSGLLPSIKFRRIPDGEPLADREAQYSAMKTCRTFVVQSDEVLAEGWHSGPAYETEKILIVGVRYVDPFSASPSGELSQKALQMIADDRDLIDKALLRTPFGETWTAVNFVNIRWNASVRTYPADDNPTIWIAEQWYRVIFER